MCRNTPHCVASQKTAFFIVKAKSKTCSKFSSTLRGLFTKNSYKQAKQAIPWYFMVTTWKCSKTSHRTFTTKLLALASRQRTVSHFTLTRGFCYQNNMTVVFYPILLARFGPMWVFSVSPIEDKTKRSPFWHNWNGGGRIAGGAEHRQRTRLQKFML
jgi:hypothetical protein